MSFNVSMRHVTQATYLGDVISEKGTIDETISLRSKKAIGIISWISSILSSVCLGNFHFDIAMVLREALIPTQYWLILKFGTMFNKSMFQVLKIQT